MSKQWMIYGANGYTGKLMAQEAVARGLEPVLAGRNQQAISALAEQLSLPYTVFDLSDQDKAVEALKDMHLVVHCAGPFSATSQPMIDACMASTTHYLDITGEIDVFANAHSQDSQAKHADIVLIPGVGFDVVPTDCLAATLVRKLPAATELELAFEAGSGPSPGTAKTSVEGLAKGGRVRREGKLVSVPLAWKTRKVPFAHGERVAMTIPWGDVFTAFISTGIPDITVYLSVPPATIKRLRRIRFMRPLFGLGFVQNFMKKKIDKTTKGPSDSRRSDGKMQLWGEVRSADGRKVSATMTTPNGYDLTVTAGLGVAQYLSANDVEGGYYTPSLLLGPDYVLTLPDVSLHLNE